MDEDEFEKSRAVEHRQPARRPAPSGASNGDLRERIRALVDASRSSSGTEALTGDPIGSAQRPGIVWVRASDLLSTSTGRVAGRGLDLEADLARRLRRAPASTRRAIRERAAKLPPLSEFGRSPATAQFARPGLGRR
ncbi:hypothetical protein [Agromyces sp. Marseille-Q5079]|uniref:hypothetical protein n=1 Tax=Agromyces sp. Marseille-Q5079 TaxID=3439059 RepID=UPI003D9C8895